MSTTQRFRGATVAKAVFLMVVGSAAASAGDLEPSAPPAPTMKTLDQIPPTWGQVLPAAQRFQLVLGGVAVLDKETGLVWERSPSTDDFYMRNVDPATYAVLHCNDLTLGNRKGWRLPLIQELASLVDPSIPSPGPMLPSGHPFLNIQEFYWSANTDGDQGEGFFWTQLFTTGAASPHPALAGSYAWCVRGLQGTDIQ